jgi:hypothetical protein
MMVAVPWAEIVEPIPENLFREPVEYIRADHYRQRQVCALLGEMARHATPESEREAAGVALDYLQRQLPLHVADVEDDLLDRMRKRCLPEDAVGEVVDKLREDYARAARIGQDLLVGLRRIAEGVPLPDLGAFRSLAAAFSETQRRRIAWENDVVLALARQRLQPGDMADLGRAMAARRGIAYPE